jgi:hypothetical protein
MGVFKRRYPDGRISKDWYINYRIKGRQYKRRIGPNKKLAEQVLMDIELKQAKGDYLGVYEAKKILFTDCLEEYLVQLVTIRYPISSCKRGGLGHHLGHRLRGPIAWMRLLVPCTDEWLKLRASVIF